MSKKQMSFLRNQGILTMVYRLLISLVIFLFFSLKISANVLYYKNDIIITEIELNIYKDFYFKNYNYEIKDSNAIKDLVLINNVIKDLKKNNKDFLNKIDNEISVQFGIDLKNNELIFNFYRFAKIRDEFIYNYFRNKLDVNEVISIFKDLDVLNLPISDNNCLVIKEIINLKENRYFINNFFNNLKNNTNNYKAKINGMNFDVCISKSNYYQLEQLIISYIRLQTEKEFELFVYEKTQN